ncbi:hypothetical protein KGF56_003059 [Candida oxycetoniae]|uniref:PH domain-containing protein n=1 Tax=Candida oxycetoniae TaxID=497107 RepID=A0AAI9SWQ3_9ASCO|nr:uncharacterized protein KGF56_003059 [Candida oxycetoniae]KAI3404159.2 hypothetical protein KGF56_003059 [Candida oxycetoniae]
MKKSSHNSENNHVSPPPPHSSFAPSVVVGIPNVPAVSSSSSSTTISSSSSSSSSSLFSNANDNTELMRGTPIPPTPLSSVENSSPSTPKTSTITHQFENTKPLEKPNYSSNHVTATSQISEKRYKSITVDGQKTTTATTTHHYHHEKQSRDKFIISPLENSCQDYLQLIEPNPVCPPSYDTLPPGGCPKFPIVQTITTFDSMTVPSINLSSAAGCLTTAAAAATAAAPPARSANMMISKPALPFEPSPLPPTYSPSIYKIGVIARKLEWISPYELSPNRSWKYLIIELNSTQLNFYTIPSHLEPEILGFQASPNNIAIKDLNNHSSFTTPYDHQFHNFVKKLGLLETNTNHNNKKRPLIRSYSLQHAKIGLASDYKKKFNVLRLRIENEQILLNFATIQDLIDWNLSINIGKDVAIDINERELPRYRTVPRRRRRRRNGRTGSSSNYDDFPESTHRASRLRAASDPSKIKGRFSRLKSKLSSTRLRSSSNASDTKSKRLDTSISTLAPQLNSLSAYSSHSEFNLTQLEIDQALSGSSQNLLKPIHRGGSKTRIRTRTRAETGAEAGTRTRTRTKAKARAQIFTNDGEDYEGGEEEDEDYDDEELNEALRRSRIETSMSLHNNDDEEDIQNMSDLPHSDEEDEEDEEEDDEDEDDEREDDEVDDEEVTNRFASINLSSSNSSFSHQPRNPSYSSYRDFKWNPKSDKVQSKRKYYRNCLRCIKPLTMEDTWVNKSLVKPTTLSPLNMAYLRIVKYGALDNSLTSNSLSSCSLVSMNKRNGGNLFKEGSGVMLPDTALSRIPNHFVKEYFVGTHGLVPREIM